jgi:hypothetical protein
VLVLYMSPFDKKYIHGNVKLLLGPSIVTKTWLVGAEKKLHAFLTLAFDAAEWSASCSCRFTPEHLVWKASGHSRSEHRGQEKNELHLFNIKRGV